MRPLIFLSALGSRLSAIASCPSAIGYRLSSIFYCLLLLLAHCHQVQGQVGPGTFSGIVSVRGPSTFPPPGAWTNEWFIATDGNDANSGTNINEPKTIDWAWTRAGTGQTDVQPGDTVFLRAGTYTASIPTGTGGPTWWTNLISGSTTDPVTFRPWENERVTFYAWTNVTMIKNQGKWTRLIGFEFYSDNPMKWNPGNFNDSISVEGYSEAGFSNTLANCVFHGLGNCIGANSDAAGTNLTMYGNNFYINGWQAFSDSQFIGTGYPMYVRQDNHFKGEPYVIKHNLFAPGFSYHVHSYSSGSPTNADMHALENAFWLHGSCATNHRPNVNAAWLTQVSGITSNFVFGGNAFYTPWTNEFSEHVLHGRIHKEVSSPGIDGPNLAWKMTNNTWFGGYATPVSTWRSATNVLFENNTIISPGMLTLIGGHGGAVPGARSNYRREGNTYIGATSDGATRFQYRENAAEDPNFTSNFATWTNAALEDITSTYTQTTGSHTQSFVWPNEYESSRAHVFIVNAQTNGVKVHANYDVDVSSVFANDTQVKVRFSCNFYQDPPHTLATVTAGKITIPMTNLVVETPIYHNGLGTFYTPGDESTNGTVGSFVVTLW